MDGDNWVTKRLIIKPTIEKDYDELAKLVFDKKVFSTIDSLPFDFRTIKAAREFVSSLENGFTIRLRDTNEAIGQFGYQDSDGDIDMFYWIGSKYQGKKFASEATIEFSNYYFEKSKSDKFIIEYSPQNIPSGKLAHKICEFMLQKHPDWLLVDKEDEIENFVVQNVSDEAVYYIKEEDYEKMQKCLHCCRCNAIEKDIFPEELSKRGAKFSTHIKFCIVSKISTK